MTARPSPPRRRRPRPVVHPNHGRCLTLLLPFSEWHLDSEDRTLARMGTDLNDMPQQMRQASHDRKTEAEAEGAIVRRIAGLMELREDRMKLLFGYADAGVPDLDAQLVATPSATEQDLAVFGVLHRIRDANCGAYVPVGADRSERSSRQGTTRQRRPRACA